MAFWRRASLETPTVSLRLYTDGCTATVQALNMTNNLSTTVDRYIYFVEPINVFAWGTAVIRCVVVLVSSGTPLCVMDTADRKL